jgi:glycosyltransferase involved in cell wall biosynthesis
MQQKKLLGTQKVGAYQMKILYIGHYKEGSGWSRAAIDLILAMDSVGIDVTCRNIKLTPNNPKINPRILELENKPLNNIDVCIQHVLPHHMVGTQKFKKNIAYFVAESNSITHNPWMVCLQNMDEVWVPNNDLAKTLAHDRIGKKVTVVPHAADISKGFIQQKFQFPDKNSFKFYYIGELNDRKNIESIVRCFHSEFATFEPVSLVLKIKKHGVSTQSLTKHCEELCTIIKKELRMYKDINSYHKELIIADDLDDVLIDMLHNSCDCFIAPSHGEGWSIPAFDAMRYGKTPICSNEGGPRDFIDRNNPSTGTLINGIYGICNHSDPAFMDIFTGREEWFIPSESEIKKSMRYYYQNRLNIDRNAGPKMSEKFSYQNIGNLIKGLLNG